uniref:anaphase-promoting complex subunit 13 isoform X1 n=1 Tax=Jaculus jaculus TaxID=51337 RepID=UPI001E1B48F8|nr:anaphase-promoting complex subunit 13 isoform X1 [Jaculus jaculus]XP_044992402.1 anaphase-promoting complex subunit 13 isoform X1 [Jaculus jaculus]
MSTRTKMMKVLWIILLLRLEHIEGEPRWGILSAFPKPMPVPHSATVFPRFFTTEKQLGLPMVTRDDFSVALGENRVFQESGTLCFTINQSHPSCIVLKKQAFGWFSGRPVWGPVNHERRSSQYGPKNDTSKFRFANYTFTELTIWFNGTFVVGDNASEVLYQPHLTPRCGGVDEGDLWPWSDCQSSAVGWADKQHLFTFSPEMRGRHPYVGAWKDGLFLQDERYNPFTKWLLCGVNGSCTDFSPFVLLQGGIIACNNVSVSIEKVEFEKEPPTDGYGALWETRNSSGGVKDIGHGCGRNTSFAPVPVCVHPPFMFVLSNFSFSNCTNVSCYLSQCWNAKVFKNAMVLRVPRWVPVPVEAPSTLSLFRQKRDFGATAAGVPYEKFTRAANLSRSLSLFFTTNWSKEFDNKLEELRRAVVQINSTRVDLSLAKGFTSWISSVFSYFKEWVGVGMFLVCCLGGCVLCLWLICRLRTQTKRDKVVISQELAALESGSSPKFGCQR